MSAKAMALAGIKIEPSRFVTMTWLEVKRRFGDQVKGLSCPGQRNHIAQLVSGWRHVKETVLSSQGTLQVARVTGPAAKSVPDDIIIDGYHRVCHWMSLECAEVPDACPFTELNVEIHKVEAKTKKEALDKVDALARSFNSKESVKKNGDFLSAAVRQAGLDAQSDGYKTGRTTSVVSYLTRVVGKAHLPTPELTSKAAAKLPVHVVMDQVLAVVEGLPRLRRVRGQMFNPGVMQALFQRLEYLGRLELDDAGRQLCTVLISLGSVGRAKTAPLAPLGSVEWALYDVFYGLTEESFKDIVLTQGNREKQYDFVCSYLRKPLEVLGTPSVAVAAAKVKR